MKHTPGPWELWGSTLVLSSMGMGVICEISELHPESGMAEHDRLSIGSPNWDEGVANARLIAAAPQMYEALEIRALYERREPPPFGHDCQWCRDCYQRLLITERKALAAARGES